MAEAKAAWAPVTPGKCHPVVNRHILSATGQAENDRGGCDSGFGKFENAGIGLDSAVGDYSDCVSRNDKGSTPETTHGVFPGSRVRLGSSEPPSMENNGTSKKRSRQGKDTDKQPRKRMRMKRHRPKVFDETRPPRARRPKSQTRTGPSTPKPRTPLPSTPKPRTQRHTKHVEKDVSGGPVRSSRRRRLDFSKESFVMDEHSHGCNGIRNEQEVELKKANPSSRSINDIGWCDRDDSFRGQNLEFSIMDQNSKACNGIKNKPEAEGSLNISGDSIKDVGSCCNHYESSSGLNLDFSIAQNKSEVGPNGVSDYGIKSLKVYRRRSKTDSCVMDQNSKASDGIENKPEVKMKLGSETRPDIKVYRRILRDNKCLKISRKVGPNCPYIYKGKRMRRSRRTQFDKLIIIAKMILRAQRQKRNIKQMHSDFIEENPLNNQHLRPGKKSLPVGKISCLNEAVSAMANFRRRRAKSSVRRNDYSSLTKFFSSMKVPKAFCLRVSKIRTRLKYVIPESDNVRIHVECPQREQWKSLPSRTNVKQSLAEFAIQTMEGSHIGDRCNQLVVRDETAQGALVTLKGKVDPAKKRKQRPKVDLDEETVRVWNQLMEKGPSEGTGQQDDDKTAYWKEQREIFNGRVDSFIARMHLIQGDRRFSPWKGSVVDSVVGVFLTQNVSDHLSSSAFMNLAARYPPPCLNEESGCDDRSDSIVNQIQHVELAEPSLAKSEELLTREKHPSSSLCDEDGLNLEDVNTISFQLESTTGEETKENVRETQEDKINWDELRTKSSHGRSGNRTDRTRDSVNWEAVRQAPVEEVAKVIMERGMNNVLAKRIKEFLDRLVKDHCAIDLEWLRDVPPEKTKDYLLSIAGLGLKSVECVRLLCLQHHAFPVDTNVGRILVRLGWVPLQPLPGDIQIHLLNDYPPLDTIQKYIWPRLCHLSQLRLYELHYQMITFGKLFCTKSKPNCNACPMRGECKHFASAYASGKHRLEGSKDQAKATGPSAPPGPEPKENTNLEIISEVIDDSTEDTDQYRYNNCEPIVEHPASPETEAACTEMLERDIEDFGSKPACTEMLESDIEDFGSKPVCTEMLERDIEDFGYESRDEGILTITLNSGKFKDNDVSSFVGEKEEVSKVLATLSPQVGSIPMPKLKYVGRLRTVHCVYELPDSHIILTEFEKREPDDPCPYLLAIWSMDDLTSSVQPRSNTLASCSGEIVQHQNDKFVRGTILIPCRTANGGSFPLNGTYFQVNEVFADQESSRVPITVPRESIWNLRRRPLFCGTSASTICKDMSLEDIVYTFRIGFICVRGFDRTTRAPRPLGRRFHLYKTKRVDDD